MKTTNGSVLKALSKQLPPAGENEQWAIATVEVKDRDGDIVRVKGIDLKYHRPESPIKVMGTTHQYKTLPDGTVPVMGIVKEFVATTFDRDGAVVPAMAFKYQYACGHDGELTDYARRMKSLYDSGVLDSFSIGFEPVKTVAMKGGLDYQQTAVFEISSAILPSNPYATVIKSLADQLGEDFNGIAAIEERLLGVQKSLEDSITKAFKSFGLRLDEIESAIVAHSIAPDRQSGNRQSGQPDPIEVIQKSLAEIQRKFNPKTGVSK